MARSNHLPSNLMDDLKRAAENAVRYVNQHIQYSNTVEGVEDSRIRRQIIEMRGVKLDKVSSFDLLWRIPNILQDFSYYDNKISIKRIQQHQGKLGNCEEKAKVGLNFLKNCNLPTTAAHLSIEDQDHHVVAINYHGELNENVVIVDATMDGAENQVFLATDENIRTKLKCHHYDSSTRTHSYPPFNPKRHKLNVVSQIGQSNLDVKLQSRVHAIDNLYLLSAILKDLFPEESGEIIEELESTIKGFESAAFEEEKVPDYVIQRQLTLQIRDHINRIVLWAEQRGKKDEFKFACIEKWIDHFVTEDKLLPMNDYNYYLKKIIFPLHEDISLPLFRKFCNFSCVKEFKYFHENFDDNFLRLILNRNEEFVIFMLASLDPIGLQKLVKKSKIGGFDIEKTLQILQWNEAIRELRKKLQVRTSSAFRMKLFQDQNCKLRRLKHADRDYSSSSDENELDVKEKICCIIL